MPRTKISTTIYLEPEQLRDLNALRDKTRRPVAGMIREAIDEWLQERLEEIPVTGDDPRQVPMDFDPEEPEIDPRDLGLKGFDPWPDMDTGGYRQ